MSKNIVFEGWLTKSPPTKRIWRTKWRRRWFALRQSGELPGQYFLDYYADRNCRRLKGTINLDLCEQVDAGLHMERGTNGTLDPKLRGSVFTIQTQSRTYHLEADCEADMVKWVDALCRVCGLQPKDNTSIDMEPYQNNYEMTTITPRRTRAEANAPYIPISECITGVRAQNTQKAFTFDPKNIVISTRRPAERASNRRRPVYMSQSQLRHNIEMAGNESHGMGEEEWKYINSSRSQISLKNWLATKTYTKSGFRAKNTGMYYQGPPVPPRPPKTLLKETLPARRSENVEEHEKKVKPQIKVPEIAIIPPSPGPVMPNVTRLDFEEDTSTLSVMHYCNLPPLPPAVDRTLKPRLSSHSIGHMSNLEIQFGADVQISDNGDAAADSTVLQYLDLDLPAATPSPDGQNVDVIHGRSASDSEDRSAYKTVDFLKTEAFNITRQDAEASRNSQH